MQPPAAPCSEPVRIILSAGALEVHLLPRSGGSIARFDLVGAGQRRALMRGTDDDRAGPLDCACFPLVPFCNRIRGGSFGFLEETIHLSPTVPDDPSPLHGQGWRGPWQLTECGASQAMLDFHHPAGEWPWDYTARQIIRLDPAGLAAELTCTNRSDRPMPCGLGFHPYHPCNAATRLDTAVRGAWTVDAAVLPVAHVPAAGHYDLRDRAICGQSLDNGFDGWSGAAIIRWGGNGPALRLSSPDARFFQVYSPTTGGLFVAEPVQHANCALNAPEAEWAALGMAVLPPGGSRTLRARWDLVTGEAAQAVANAAT